MRGKLRGCRRGVGADEESAAVVQPGEGAFDYPAASAEAGAVFGLAASDYRLDSAFPDVPAIVFLSLLAWVFAPSNVLVTSLRRTAVAIPANAARR